MNTPENQSILERLFAYANIDISLAKKLEKRFGLFSAVIEAPEQELAGIAGEQAAQYIKLVFDGIKRYSIDNARSLQRIFNTESAKNAIAPNFIGKKTECVGLLILDGRGSVLYNDIINEGAVSAVPVYVRRIVELCVIYCADTVIISHNHPGGNANPSKNDLISTEAVIMALKSIDVQLYDHIILTDKDFFSMRRAGWLDNMEKRTMEIRRSSIQRARAIEQDFFGKEK